MTKAARKPKPTPLARQVQDAQDRLKLHALNAQLALVERSGPGDRIPRRNTPPAGGGPAYKIVNAKGLSQSYTATRRDRLKGETAEILAPADSHLDQYSLDKLRRDSHHLYRNSPLARAVIGAVSNAINGPQGPNLSFGSEDRDFAQQAGDWFWAWANNEDGPQGKFDSLGRQTLMQAVRSAPGSWLIDGDFAEVRLTDGSVRLFEASEIRSPSGLMLTDGRTVANGIEYDRRGAPMAMHVMPWKPGQRNGPSMRIPWDAVTLLSNPVHRRLNQTRGEPGLAALAHYIELIDDSMDSTVLAHRMSTYASLVLTLKDPAATRAAAIAQTAAIDGGMANPSPTGAPQEVEWNPGSLLTLKEGESAMQVKPEHPGGNIESFLRFLIRFALSDVGCPSELAILDATETNYHGFKSAVGNAYRGFSWQQYVLSEWLVKLTTWRVGLWILDGSLSAPDDWNKIEWRFAGPPVIDPVQEIMAATRAWDGKVKTRTQILGDLGYTGSYRDFNTQLAAEQQDLKDKQIDVKNAVGINDQPQQTSKPAAQTA
jgi:capsid protein